MLHSELCQCPEWGDLHFYLDIINVITDRLIVSMP